MLNEWWRKCYDWATGNAFYHFSKPSLKELFSWKYALELHLYFTINYLWFDYLKWFPYCLVITNWNVIKLTTSAVLIITIGQKLSERVLLVRRWEACPGCKSFSDWDEKYQKTFHDCMGPADLCAFWVGARHFYVSVHWKNMRIKHNRKNGRWAKSTYEPGMTELCFEVFWTFQHEQTSLEALPPLQPSACLLACLLSAKANRE